MTASNLCEQCGVRTCMRGLGVCEWCFDNAARQSPYPEDHDD